MALDPTPKSKRGYQDEYGRFIQAPDYFDEYTTPDDIKRAQGDAFAEYGVNAGIGALGLVGQEALSFVDTAQDTKNKSELGRLEGLERRGKLGLTGEERTTYERGLLNPIKAMGAEQGRRDEARLAGGGNVGRSAADVVRVQRESDRRLDEAGLAAAQKIEQAHLQRKADQRQEMEERRSYESGRETQRLNLIAETIPGILANVGKVAAGVALPAQMTDAQIIRMQKQTDAAGAPLWPGLTGKSVADARALLAGAAWETLARRRAQGGDISATGAQAGASPGGAPSTSGPDTLGIAGER